MPKQNVMRYCLVPKFRDSEEHTYWGIGFSKEEGTFINQCDWGDRENWLGRLLMSLQEFLLNLDSLDPNFENEYQKIYRLVHRQIIVTTKIL